MRSLHNIPHDNVYDSMSCVCVLRNRLQTGKHSNEFEDASYVIPSLIQPTKKNLRRSPPKVCGMLRFWAALWKAVRRPASLCKTSVRTIHRCQSKFFTDSVSAHRNMLGSGELVFADWLGFLWAGAQVRPIIVYTTILAIASHLRKWHWSSCHPTLCQCYDSGHVRQ